jgi:hypothetical protein
VTAIVQSVTASVTAIMAVTETFEADEGKIAVTET